MNDHLRLKGFGSRPRHPEPPQGDSRSLIDEDYQAYGFSFFSRCWRGCDAGRSFVRPRDLQSSDGTSHTVIKNGGQHAGQITEVIDGRLNDVVCSLASIYHLPADLALSLFYLNGCLILSAQRTRSTSIFSYLATIPLIRLFELTCRCRSSKLDIWKYPAIKLPSNLSQFFINENSILY
jgi:hypothetical protein